MGKKIMIINYDYCNGCYNCQIACKDEHCANDWTPIAKPQPDTGQFWHKITDNVRGQVPKVFVTYEHSMCQHCEDAPCIKACKSNAIYQADDGAVIIDPTKCRGNKLCIEACPYDNVIYYNKDLLISQKCTFCEHLLQDGWDEPRCVDACPIPEAMVFGDEDDPKIKELLKVAEPLCKDNGITPRVYYIGIPKRFIAGAVYDEGKDECIEGAKVVAECKATGAKSEPVTTDSYGDFWIKGLEKGVYKVTIEADGYPTKEIEVDVTEKDINAGDFALDK